MAIINTEELGVELNCVFNFYEDESNITKQASISLIKEVKNTNEASIGYSTSPGEKIPKTLAKTNNNFGAVEADILDESGTANNNIKEVKRVIADLTNIRLGQPHREFDLIKKEEVGDEIEIETYSINDENIVTFYEIKQDEINISDVKPEEISEVQPSLGHKITNTIICNICANTFLTVEALINHLKSIHDASGNDYLQNGFPKNLTNLKKKKKNVSYNSFVCRYCGKFLLSAKGLQNHLRAHQPKKAIFLKQDKVRHKLLENNETSRNYLLGEEVSNGNTEKRLLVDLSKAIFQYKSTIQIKQTADGKQYVCEICQKLYNNRYELENHFITHTREENYKCPICQKLFRSFLHLKQHLKLHFSIEQKYEHLNYNKKKICSNLTSNMKASNNKYSCPICKRQYKNLDSHMKVHTEERERNYECLVCFLKFEWRSSLKRHELIHSEKKHSCHICHRVFRQKIHLEMHLMSHTKSFKHRCKICFKGFYHRQVLEDHLSQHEGIQKYDCPICKKKFFFRAVRNHHMKLHSETKYNCPICFKTFALASYLKLHVERHFKETKKREYRKSKNTHALENCFECHICSKVLRTKSSLKRHIEGVHLRVYNYECSQCPKKFYKKKGWVAHTRLHTGEKYRCFMCSASYTEKRTLQVHIRRIHEGEEVFRCSQCPRNYADKSSLEEHCKTHIGKEVVCGICSKTFKQRAALKIHLNIHTGEKRFQCKICLKDFSQKGHLIQHNVIHTGEKRYQCKLCLKRFSFRWGLKCHENVHKKNKVECQICLNLFTKGSLKRHMDGHKDVRKYQCSICSKAFLQKTHLGEHMINHTGVKEHKCLDCPKAFASIYKLRRHQDMHKKNNLISQDWKEKFECKICSKAFPLSSYLKRHVAMHETDPQTKPTSRGVVRLGKDTR